MSNKKDPACLFFISNWLVATKEMKAECRGWYLNLILHQYDKGSLPDDIEELANLADVRMSEFDKFKQVFEQVLKQKFNKNEIGRLENPMAKEILKSREMFKEKRSAAGKLSYFLKFCRANGAKEKEIEFIKSNVDLTSVQTNDEQVLKQVFEQTLELYINRNRIRNINNNTNNINIPFHTFWDLYDNKTGRRDCERIWSKLKDDERDLIIKNIPAYKSRTDPSYLKNPKTYLNQRVWEDEKYQSIIPQRRQPYPEHDDF